MTRHTCPIVLFAVLVCSFLSCEFREKDPPPNVLFILVDDLGWKDLGSYGSKFYDTPNLDSLAGKAVRFTDAYSAHPVCSPTRAAIMTGKDPVRVGITDWIPGMATERAQDPRLIPPEDIHHLPLEEITIAEAFREHGYRTFFAGKWHLGETPQYWPEHQGFDINKGGHDRGSPPGGYYSPYENPRLEDGPEGEYLTDRLADESIRFLEQMDEAPFFLFLSFYTVHTPIEGAEEFDEFYRQKMLALPDEGSPESRQEGFGETRLNQSDYQYAAMVRSMDENVGRILDRLEALDLSDNTIIVFTSDNGGLTTLQNGSRVAPTAVTPLRAGKGWAYEGGIRVPLIIKAPGLPEGAVSRQPVTSMDFYPTLLELAGLPSRDDQHMDGKSITNNLFHPDQIEKRTLVWHYPHYHGSAWRPGSAIRQGRWKLIEFYEENKVELYDLTREIGEMHDVAEQNPDTADTLRDEMHTYIEERGGKYPEWVMSQ
jgi:arylsulfatase A-like enzyme